MANFCGSCGSKLDDNTNFCPRCGSRIEKKTSMNNKPKAGVVEKAGNQPEQPVSVQKHPDQKVGNKPYVDIFIDGKIHLAKQTTQEVFLKNGFRVQWLNEHSGRAKKGNAGLAFAFGAIAQSYTIDFQIFTMPEGNSGVRLFKSSDGWQGGVWGSVKTKRQYFEIVNMLAYDFDQRGIYKGKFP